MDALSRTSDVNEAQQAPVLLNSWWCDRLMAEVMIIRNEHGKLEHLVRYEGRGGRLVRKIIDNLALTNAWLFEAEIKAQAKLKAMIKPHLFEAYVMTGTFLETSKRSGVTYLFRRLRPTIACTGRSGEMRILCALCLHPIGYYQDTNAGVMVPTDDVIAHLVYMRGDEHAFWKQANQHQPNHPNAVL